MGLYMRRVLYGSIPGNIAIMYRYGLSTYWVAVWVILGSMPCHIASLNFFGNEVTLVLITFEHT